MDKNRKLATTADIHVGLPAYIAADIASDIYAKIVMAEAAVNVKKNQQDRP